MKASIPSEGEYFSTILENQSFEFELLP
uniref:Uncharacterized protein n=1 Tax=Lepeophtheirus salmonis TaxID=72036 RepID=A0A0K2U0H9_LEPSM